MTQFLTRSFAVRADTPTTVNDEERSVEIVVASDTDEILRYDWDLDGYVPEILIMSGCELPESGRVSLLDSHDRWSVKSVYGSVRDLRVDGNKLLGKAVYAEDSESDAVWKKTRGGHVTDYSVGFTEREITKLKKGETKELDGRVYTGPAVLITRWGVREVSTCPIGADSSAKSRSKENYEQEEKSMAGKEKPQEPEKNRSDNPPENKRQENTPHESRAEKVDEEKIRAEAVKKERERVSEITEMCRSFGCDDIAKDLIDKEKTVDQARAAVLDHMKERSKKSEANNINARFDGVLDEMDKFRSAAEHALSIRAGIGVEKPAPGADELAGFSLRELAREYIYRSGGRAEQNPIKMVGRALTTTDFPILLGNIANTSLVAGWEEANETWNEWCSTGNLPDFKPHHFAQSGAFEELDEIPEHGEYKHGSFGEAKESVKIAKYGKLAAITREAIINDDMGAIADTPRKMGLAAARKIGDLPCAVLIANAKMGDNIPLFHATHKNLAATGAALGVTPLNTAFADMAKQKDFSGRKRLNIRPAIYLSPVSIMGTSEEFFKTDKIDNLENGTRKTNIYSGNVLKRVYESRLDDDSETAWYLLAGQKNMTVTVFFLHGNDKPYMEQKNGWSVDGVEYKVRIEAAAAARDFRGMYKNPGA